MYDTIKQTMCKILRADKDGDRLSHPTKSRSWTNNGLKNIYSHNIYIDCLFRYWKCENIQHNVIIQA